MPTFKEFADTKFVVKMKKPQKYKKINPNSNRMKTFKRTRYISTEVTPEKRGLGNMPKYANGGSKVSFTDWLGIKDGKKGYGKSANGKWYGWSHRAVYGFKAGDKVTGDSLGKKVTYPKFTAAQVKAVKQSYKDDDGVHIIPTIGELDFDNGKYEDDFTIRGEKHAEEVAARFHDNVS